MMFLVVGTSSLVCVCEPCAEVLNFKETVQQADLIVLGEKAGNGPLIGLSYFPDAASWIEIDILDILKGQEAQKRIRVNSWNGMCGYGIVIGEGQHVIFLVKTENSPGGHQYDAVNYGCSVKTYPVKDDRVIFNGKDISKEGFLRELNKSLNTKK